jgi:hypothetical protein
MVDLQRCAQGVCVYVCVCARARVSALTLVSRVALVETHAVLSPLFVDFLFNTVRYQLPESSAARKAFDFIL